MPIRVAGTVIVMRGDFRMVLSEHCTSFHKRICTPRRTIEDVEIWPPASQSSTHVEPTNFTRT